MNRILIALLLGVYCFAFGQSGANKVAVCYIERDIEKAERVNFSPVAEGSLMNQLQASPYSITVLTPLPLMSKETVEYTLAKTVGHLSTYSGYVHLEAGSDGSINFHSDKGQNVLLKTEVSAVHWMIDREQAIRLAKDKGYNYILIAEVTPKDFTAEIKKNFETSSQKSINVAMNLILLNLKTDKAEATFADDVSRMDIQSGTAIRDGVKYLTSKFVKSLNKE
ncbi:MAG: hypothetical protein LWX56_01965 [Ignavibacteria bacterium]|nr:hypothetical protein [Ignavibacteria bacterium]